MLGPKASGCGREECAEIQSVSFAAILDNIAMSRSAVVRGFASLLTPKTDAELDALADRARELTLQHFGRTMRLFAPLYLSNECINSCRYCGFSR